MAENINCLYLVPGSNYIDPIPSSLYVTFNVTDTVQYLQTSLHLCFPEYIRNVPGVSRGVTMGVKCGLMIPSVIYDNSSVSSVMSVT